MPELRSRTVTHGRNMAGARALLTLAGMKQPMEEALVADTGPQRIVVLEELLEGDAPACEFPQVKSEDLCFLQFTSGSTSLPKGVMVTHANVVANARAFLGPHGAGRASDRARAIIRRTCSGPATRDSPTTGSSNTTT